MRSMTRQAPCVALLLLCSWPALGQDPPGPCRADGGLDYYRCRADDATRRGADVPDYYLGYGDKYMRRFTFETRRLLSPEGQAWVDRVRSLLQEAMERRRESDPAVFGALERDSSAFLDFAYATHPAAYMSGGLATLPVRDLVLIATTPDVQDLLTPRGLGQIAEVLRALVDRCRSEGVAECLVDRVLREGRDQRRLFEDGLGLRPAGAVGRFLVNRVVDSTIRALGLPRAEPTRGLAGAMNADATPVASPLGP